MMTDELEHSDDEQRAEHDSRHGQSLLTNSSAQRCVADYPPCELDLWFYAGHTTYELDGSPRMCAMT